MYPTYTPDQLAAARRLLGDAAPAPIVEAKARCYAYSPSPFRAPSAEYVADREAVDAWLGRPAATPVTGAITLAMRLAELAAAGALEGVATAADASSLRLDEDAALAIVLTDGRTLRVSIVGTGRAT